MITETELPATPTPRKRRKGGMRDGVVKRGGKWAFVLSISDGPKRRLRWFSGYDSREEAVSARAKAITERNCGIDIEPNRLTVAELLTRWLEATKARIGAKTFQRYESIVAHHLLPQLGALKLAKLKPLHIEAAIAAWAQGERRDGKKGNLSPRSVGHNLDTLRTALRWPSAEASSCVIRPTQSNRRSNGITKCGPSTATASRPSYAPRAAASLKPP